MKKQKELWPATGLIQKKKNLFAVNRQPKSQLGNPRDETGGKRTSFTSEIVNLFRESASEQTKFANTTIGEYELAKLFLDQRSVPIIGDIESCRHHSKIASGRFKQPFRVTTKKATEKTLSLILIVRCQMLINRRL